MKKTLLLLLLTITCLISVTTVSADIGPKPNVTITIIGMEETPYTFDLLIDGVDGNFYDPETHTDIYGHYLGEEYPDELYTFETSDGYSVWSLYGSPMPDLRQLSSDFNEQEYRDAYYPPQQFKVLLYLEDGTTIVSELVSRYYFDSTMVWDVSDVSKTTSSEGEGTISGNIHIGLYEEITGWDRLDVKSIPRLIIRILITITIELGVLFAFRYKQKKSFGIVTITNAATQIALTFFVARQMMFFGAFSALYTLFIGELIVFSVEAIIYLFFLKEKKIASALSYAFVANMTSLIIGYVLVPIL